MGRLWTGPRLLWHINCLELWAVHLALWQFRPLLLGKHVFVRRDNTAAVLYINRLGGIRSHRMSQLTRHLLLWSPTQFKSLRAVHIPGKLNRAADALSRQLLFPGEWRLHPETTRLIWSRFGETQVNLFASPESSHCQLYFSLTEGPLGIDALAHSWPRALRKYSFPPVSLLAQTLCKLREDEEQVLLVAPHWPTRTWFPELISLMTAPTWHIPLRKDILSQGLGTIWHLRPDLWNLHVRLMDRTWLTTMHWMAGPWESMISSWGSWRGPGRWIPPGHPLCPLGTSLSSWLDFRWAPLSRWTQSSWSSCLLRQRSWPRSVPSNGSGTSRRFGKRRVPCVRAGLLSRCLKTLAWIRVQGSHHALPRSGGEPASTALGGGRSSLSVAVGRCLHDVNVKQITKYICRKDELQLHLVQTYIMHIRLYVLK